MDKQKSLIGQNDTLSGKMDWQVVHIVVYLTTKLKQQKETDYCILLWTVIGSDMKCLRMTVISVITHLVVSGGVRVVVFVL